MSAIVGMLIGGAMVLAITYFYKKGYRDGRFDERNGIDEDIE